MMLDGLHMDLPQIRSKPRDAFDEEISWAEVEGAINVSHEISALGLYGKPATAPYFYGSILLQALKSEIILLLTYEYKK